MVETENATLFYNSRHSLLSSSPSIAMGSLQSFIGFLLFFLQICGMSERMMQKGSPGINNGALHANPWLCLRGAFVRTNEQTPNIFFFLHFSIGSPDLVDNSKDTLLYSTFQIWVSLMNGLHASSSFCNDNMVKNIKRKEQHVTPLHVSA